MLNPAYSDSKYFAKRIILDKILKDRAYENAINPNYDGYQRGLASMVFKFFDKNVWCTDFLTGLGASVNEELAQELHKEKHSKEGNSMPGLKIIFGQQI